MPLVNGTFTEPEMNRKIGETLFDSSSNWRYRWLYGGRGAGKDWGICTAVVELSIRKPMRVLFTREIQNSIKDSIYRLLVDTIERLGYAEYFDILESEIRGKNGSLFIFRGIRHNTNEIKSMEGIDLCVLCEAQDLTRDSWNILDPTIRKEGSEIWGDFNTGFEDDFVYDKFVTNKPDNAIVCQVNYVDNKWCPDELKQLAARMEREDNALYQCVWLGKPMGQGGRVFPMYNPAVHEIAFDMDFLFNCDLYMSIDPHRKYYPAISWYAVTKTGCVVVYNEFPKYEDLGAWYDEVRTQKAFDMTLSELANIILANDLTLHGGKIRARTGDPRFFAENPDIVTKLQEHGVMGWVDAPFENIETQREHLKELISYNPAIPIAGTNLPDWFVSQKCKNKGRAYRRHCWDQNEKDKESERNKDFIDTDRYFLSLFPDGRPVYYGNTKQSTIGQIKSLASSMMETLPARGYFAPVGQKRESEPSYAI